MAHTLSAYSFESELNDSQAGTPSMDAFTPISSYASSPAPSTTQSDEPYIPRPSNCFFIFRSEFLSLDGKSLSREQTKASVSAAAAWKELPEKRRAHYKDLARRRKEEHARKHPGYKYNPRRSKCGKRAHGRKKINAPQTQISLDAQRFCHAPPSSVPTAPEILHSTVQVSSPISKPTQPFMVNGNENEISPGLATSQAMYLTQSLYHPTPSASLRSIGLDIPQTGGLDTMNESEDLGQFLARLYRPDLSHLDMITDQLDGSLYNEWGFAPDLGYRAADDPMNYSSLLPDLPSLTLSSIINDGAGVRIF